eukprot:1102056-Rhodomonas_salina.1
MSAFARMQIFPRKKRWQYSSASVYVSHVPCTPPRARSARYLAVGRLGTPHCKVPCARSQTPQRVD